MSERFEVEDAQLWRVDAAGVAWLIVMTLALAAFIGYVVVWS